MKRALAITFYFALCGLTIFSQEPPGESQKLNQQMAVFNQQGDLDQAARLAEQIVALQRREKSSNSQNLTNALENLAQIKLSRFKRSAAELSAANLKPDDAKTILERRRDDAKNTEDSLREALQIAASGEKKMSAQIVALKNNLAWLLYNYFPLDGNLPTGFDKQARDKFDALNKLNYYKRINEAGKLYDEAIKSSEAEFGVESEIWLLSNYNAAEFQTATGNFENALPQYEKCIAVVEKKYGKTSRNLLPLFDSYTKALLATGQDDLAFEAVSRVVRITGKSSNFPTTLLNLSYRADKSFTSVNVPDVERKARENENLAQLRNRGSIIGAGNDSGAYSQALGSSTNGKIFYENSGAIEIIRIPVKVTIDENGKTIETEALTADKSFKAVAEKAVSEWRFRPFSANNQRKKLKGYVECLFLAERFKK